MPRPMAVLAGMFVVLATAAAARDDEDGRARLASIPRDQRTRLAEKLRAFDALDRPTQQAIRALDDQLAALPAAERAGYQAVLRRYHLWLEGLPEAQRNEIRALPPDQRMAAVQRLLAEPTPTPPRAGASMILRMVELGDDSPFDLADQVKVWQVATPAQRTELGRLAPPARERRLKALAAEHHVSPVARPNRPSDETLLERAQKKGLPPLWNLRRKDDPAGKGDGNNPRAARVRARMLEQLAFLEAPPARVSPDHLARFAASLPPWVRSGYDPLPPDEARRRLTVLYRLIYPPPAEYVEPKPASTAAATKGASAPPATPAAPAPPATPKPGGGSSPF